MSLMDKIWVPKPKQEPEETITPVSKNKPTPKPSGKVSVASYSAAPYVAGAEVRKDLLKILVSAMEDASDGKFDYFKFREVGASMEKHIPDEATRFNAASASASAMGVSPEDLIDSAQKYIKVLDTEYDKFNGELASSFEEVGEKEKQLKLVTKQLADLQEQKDSLEKEIEEGNSSAAKNKADFEAAYDQIAGSIKQDILKIKKYLLK